MPTITTAGLNLVSVFNGATCNATNAAGCQQTPATLRVGDSAGGSSSLNIAVDQATNTVYATNVVLDTVPLMGNSVYVIDGATCDAVTHAGCTQTPATVTIASEPPIGSNPGGIAVDQATNTVYTANIADGEHPGSVSIINGNTCNGHDEAGCNQIPACAQAGFGTVGIAIDRTTGRVYATNTEDTSVSVISENTRDRREATGCSQTPHKLAVGDYPGAIAVDPTAGSAYVQDVEGVSVIPLNH